jgi:hypothetical protein
LRIVEVWRSSNSKREKSDMSSWWCIVFCVVGDIDEVTNFEQTLSSLFHQVAGTDRIGGALAAEVFQNYGGEAAVENAIDRFPDLLFVGTQIHEQAHPGDIFWVFTGEKGITEWRELRLPENGSGLMARAEVEKEIARINARMARLTKQRDLLLGSNNLDITVEGPPADRLAGSEEVASIVSKVKNDAANVPKAIPQN